MKILVVFASNLDFFIYYVFQIGLSPFQKNCFIRSSEIPLKMMKNAF